MKAEIIDFKKCTIENDFYIAKFKPIQRDFFNTARIYNPKILDKYLTENGKPKRRSNNV